MSGRCGRHATLSLIILLAACTTTPPAPVVTPARPAATTARPAAAVPTPTPPRGGIAAPQEPARPLSVHQPHPAIGALLSTARDAIAAGRFDHAGAKIDQAMRIDSADPWVWHALARLRFARGEFAQAIATARRSNALGGAPADLLFANLNLVAEAERLRGNPAASAQALSDARRYESGAVRSD